MDDEDDKLCTEPTASVTILSKKCKPFNICLDRLDIPKNGVVLIDNESKESKSSMADSVKIENSVVVPSTSVATKGELDGDDSSNDAAETIKKIREFIAKCDEPKKVLDVLEKEVNNKPRPLSKKILIQSFESQGIKEKPKEVISELSNLHTNLELERTLKGLNNEQDLKENIDKPQLNSCENSIIEKDLNASKIGAISSKHNSITPSRVSKRIQSKSVKFSVKKMLRGDDVNVLKRMIPGYEGDKRKKRERSTPKVLKGETRRIIHSPKSLSPSYDSTDGVDISKDVIHINNVNEEQQPDESLIDQPSSPLPPPSPGSLAPTSNASIVETIDKMSMLSEKLDQFPVTNGKITVELKGQQKKVVRIAMPPQKSPSLKNMLGPDIIVKRVKPIRKTIILPTNVKPTPKTVIEKEIQNYRPSDLSSSPHVKIERIPMPKLKENLVHIRKNFLKRGRTEKKWDHKETVQTVSTDQALENNDNVRLDVLDKGITQNDEGLSLTQQISEVLEKTVIKCTDDPSYSPDDNTKKKSYKKKIKLDIPIKRSTRLRRLDESLEKSESEEEQEVEEENESARLFDKYFMTEDRFVEHHDSLDSDSSEDYDTEMYSHFFDLKRNKTATNKSGKGSDNLVTDLMRDISADLPSWNIHVSNNGETFNIVQVDIINGKPTLKKSIEMDSDFNVKVYIDDKLLPEYEGNYCNYDSIKQLIYFVDQL